MSTLEYKARKAKNTRDFYHRQKERISKLAADRKLSIVKIIGGCQLCGYQKPHNLSFHHLDPSAKEHAVDKREFQSSWKKVKKELLKCILVCHHCHGDIHYEGKLADGCHEKIQAIIAPLQDWPTVL